MLDVNVKENVSNGAADVETFDQYDAAEFNSIFSESKNLVTQQGGILTALTSNPYLPGNDDEFLLNKAVIAAGGWIMPTLSSGSSETVFTSGAAGAGNFPKIEQFTDKMLAFKMGNSDNTGAYTIDYDGSGSFPVLNKDGIALGAGDLPAGSIVQIYYNGVDEWTVRSIADPSSFYINGNGGVIFQPSDQVADFNDDSRNWQIGPLSMLSAEDIDDSSWFAYNAFHEADFNDFNRIQTGEWAGRTAWDTANGRWVLQYSLATDADLSFEFRDGFGMNEFGDFFQGEGATVNTTDDDFWVYKWYGNNRVEGWTKGGTPDEFYFRGVNCYPTGSGPTIQVTTTGFWEFTIESPLGWFKYSGNDTAGSIGSLGSISAKIISQIIPDQETVGFNTKNASFVVPMGLGGLLRSEFLVSDPRMIQHQLGFLSSINTPKDDFLWDVYGSGFHSELLFGSDTSDYSFGASSTANLNAKVLLSTQDGFILGFGDDNTLGGNILVRSSPTDFVQEFGLPDPDSFIIVSAIANQAETSLFFLGQNGSTSTNIFRSINDGLAWSIVNAIASVFLNALSLDNDGLLMVVNIQSDSTNPKIRYSSDDGVTWTTSSNAVPNIDYVAVVSDEKIRNQAFRQHPDGDYFFAGPALTTGYMTLYKTTTIGGSWSLVSLVLTGSFGARGCLFIDPFDGSIYVGTADSSNFSVIRRSDDLGATWTTVYTAPSAIASISMVQKIISSPEGVLYAASAIGTDSYELISSTDRGLTWVSIVTISEDIHDMIYAPADNALFVTYDNNVSTGFLVDRYPTEVEIATENGTLPTKIRQISGEVSISIAKEIVDNNDTIDFGVPVVNFARQTLGLLKNFGAVISKAKAKVGGFFRLEFTAGSYLWVKELDGATYPLNSSLPPMQLTAGFFTPDPANVGSFATIEIGEGDEKGSFDILSMGDQVSPNDFYYSQITPPENWTSRKLTFRVSFIVPDTISGGDDVSFRLGVRRLVRDAQMNDSWVSATIIEVLADTLGDSWRKTELSAEIELPAYDAGVDSLNFRINRDNTSGSNESGDVKFSEIVIHWSKI